MEKTSLLKTGKGFKMKSFDMLSILLILRLASRMKLKYSHALKADAKELNIV